MTEWGDRQEELHEKICRQHLWVRWRGPHENEKLLPAVQKTISSASDESNGTEEFSVWFLSIYVTCTKTLSSLNPARQDIQFESDVTSPNQNTASRDALEQKDNMVNS